MPTFRRRSAAAVAVTAAVFAAAPAAAAEPIYDAPVGYPAGQAGAGNGQGSVAAGDLDADGHADLVMTDMFNGIVRVLFNDGTGAFGGEIQLPKVGNQPRALDLVDLDEDGRLDLPVADETGTLTIFRNDGGRKFSQAGSHPTPSRPYHIVPDDYNGDGHADLAILGTSDQGQIAVLLGDGQGGLKPLPVFEFGADLLDPGNPAASLTEHVYPGFQQMDAGDLNGDGVPDLVAAGGQTLYVFTGDGDGTFTPAPTVTVDARGLEPIQLVDTNADGHLDAIIPDPSGNVVSVFPGKGDATFGPAVVSTVNPAGQLESLTVAVAVGVAEMTGDGVPDIAVSGGLDHSVWIMTGTGDGRFATAERHFITAKGFFQEARAIVPAELTGDGRADLVIGTEGYDSHTWVLRQR